jgi:hypothetical protein
MKYIQMRRSHNTKVGSYGRTVTFGANQNSSLEEGQTLNVLKLDLQARPQKKTLLLKDNLIPQSVSKMKYQTITLEKGKKASQERFSPVAKETLLSLYDKPANHHLYANIEKKVETPRHNVKGKPGTKLGLNGPNKQMGNYDSGKYLSKVKEMMSTRKPSGKLSFFDNKPNANSLKSSLVFGSLKNETSLMSYQLSGVPFAYDRSSFDATIHSESQLSNKGMRTALLKAPIGVLTDEAQRRADLLNSRQIDFKSSFHELPDSACISNPELAWNMKLLKLAFERKNQEIEELQARNEQLQWQLREQQAEIDILRRKGHEKK